MAGTRSIVLGLLLLMAGVAHAEETGRAFVIGTGFNSCGKLIAAMGKNPPGKHEVMNTRTGAVFFDESAKYQEWLMGFVSGFNSSHASEPEQQVTGIDLARIDLWMRNWCKQHPTQSVSQGAAAFIIEMQSNAAAGRR